VPISSPPSSTFTHPQLQPYHTQIGALCHYRASNQSFTICLTNSDASMSGRPETAAGTLSQSRYTSLSFVIQPVRDDPISSSSPAFIVNVLPLL
jgi:hypothetical protein